MPPTRRRFLIATASAAPAISLPRALPAAVGGKQVIEVTLWDDPDKDMMIGLCHGMGGDMSKARMGIRPGRSGIPAGRVTFDVTISSGSPVHEMVVTRIQTPGRPLPRDVTGDAVDEDKAGHLGEVAEPEPGRSGALTLELEPGRVIPVVRSPVTTSPACGPC